MTNISTEDATPRNRLADEKSPYLLQHQANPVDWYPWGEEAFEKARREDKPIFLSIGYSTCHWCHVMERETFENKEVARFLNEHFVSIKVDREERPDVDKIYMTFAQATTGQGGWPLNLFLTPDLKPFFAGTYFPPDNRYGRPGFLQVLEKVDETWRTRRDHLASYAADVHQKLRQHMEEQAPQTEPVLNQTVLDNAASQLKAEYDPKHGGFGSAPKFPRPSHPGFLLQYGTRHGVREPIDMVLHTCDAMAAGGIYDHIGGGFHRYSVDEKWLIPHFEKMLYDNAQLLTLYLDAYRASGRSRYAEIAHDIIRYILRDMTHPEGGFYSAEDADSEGKEGKFYCWTRDDLAGLLTPEELEVVIRYFGVTEQGNFLDHSDPDPLHNQNVLSIVDSALSETEQQRLTTAKRKMFDAREKRVRPHRDDKILASWNGLMLSGLARAAAVLGEPSYREAAEKNLDFLKSNLWDPDKKRLFHRWRDGECDRAQLVNGYAFLLAGVIDLYEATLSPNHLMFAKELADAMLDKFFDSEKGGFWQSADADELILGVKEDHDGAEPSGSSVATWALLKLYHVTYEARYKEAAEKTLYFFRDHLRSLPQAVPSLLAALDFSLSEPQRVVLTSESADHRLESLLQAVHQVYEPVRVVLGSHEPVEDFAQSLRPKENRPTAFVCTGTTCQPPTHEPDQIRRHLRHFDNPQFER